MDDSLHPVIPLGDEHSAHLELIHTPAEGAAKRIPCRRVVTILGSRNGSKIQLQHRTVSPVHLVLFNEGRRVIAVDLVTQTGTRLNDLPLQYETLTNGDRLEVGPFAFEVRITEPVAQSESEVQLADLEGESRAVALEHIESGKLFKLNREACLIGRAQGCDIAIADPRVSRVHALILMYQNRPHVLDLLSENHTLLNSRPVRFAHVADSDTLQCGDTLFRFRVVPAHLAVAPHLNGSVPKSVPSKGERPEDLIDIQATESRNRWHIVDSYERSMRKPH